MKLEYLADGSPDCPLIRLYEFDQSEAKLLIAAVKSLAACERQRVALHDESWVESVGGCSLNLRRGDRDEGIRRSKTSLFECVFAPASWGSVEGLLKPFVSADTSGFQWLTNDGEVALFISATGQW